MNNCQWSGCTEDALPGHDLCKYHQKKADDNERREREAVVNKTDGLRYHPDRTDHRHGEKAGR